MRAIEQKANDLASEPKPEMELRVKVIYSFDEGTTPIWTLENIQEMVTNLIETTNRHLKDSGLRLVTSLQQDVEIHECRL
ncbi:hypothetical protein SPSYN_03097 [Sporotomaculum syntrophicum]|uniref:Uncharacterized protein n=1 Tax=Sporotomaculum syntrophicum TaxID=182264 RepID=A0A9D2WMT0_9FIRM|nr:hypothetical protein [Sporotomaculum syntrophicum]KAF1083748.1 hypothetical protein SPSYN_03097 [Sporotomaculum syntrophicum]